MCVNISNDIGTLVIKVLSSNFNHLLFIATVKPVLSGHLKIDQSKVLKTNGRLLKVESIAECSLGAFCNTFDLH